jgi:hypothetical protein
MTSFSSYNLRCIGVHLPTLRARTHRRIMRAAADPRPTS